MASAAAGPWVKEVQLFPVIFLLEGEIIQQDQYRSIWTSGFGAKRGQGQLGQLLSPVHALSLQDFQTQACGSP